MNPEISILVPVYKTEKFLKRCINSIIKQSFKNWELIIVNDCSPDNSSETLADYEKRESRIKIVTHTVNSGVSQARFTGLDHAKGKYIVFVDSDDWIADESLRILYDKIELEQADIVIGSMVKILDRFNIFKTKPRNSVSTANITTSITLPELFDDYYINYFGCTKILWAMWGRIYRREAIDRAPLKPSPYSFAEDMIFNFTLHPYLKKISFVSDTVYYYRYGGMTSRAIPRMMEITKELYGLKEDAIRKYNYASAIPWIQYEVVEFFYSHFRNLVLLDGISFDELKKRIKEELSDDFYSNQNLYEGIDRKSEKSLALKDRDVDRIANVIREIVKKDRPRHLIARAVSKLLT